MKWKTQNPARSLVLEVERRRPAEGRQQRIAGKRAGSHFEKPLRQFEEFAPCRLFGLSCLNTDRIEAVPAGRLPYFPVAPKLSEFPDKPFADLEAQEFSSDGLAKALKTADSLATSSDPLVRGGALLRKARILRKLNRSADAIECYDRISRIPFAAIEGTPADLVARKAKCATFAEFGRQKEQHQEAEALAADLRVGK